MFVFLRAWTCISESKSGETAVISALSIWSVMAITLSFLAVIQLYSPSGYLRNSLLYLVASIIVSIVGAAIYKE